MTHYTTIGKPNGRAEALPALSAKLTDTTHYTTTGKLNGRAGVFPALSAKLIDMTHYSTTGKLNARAEVFPAAVRLQNLSATQIMKVSLLVS